MSAFIVDSDNVNGIVAWLHADAISRSTRQGEVSTYGSARTEILTLGYDIEDYGDCEQLATAMFALNVYAVQQRYPGEPVDQLPGCGDNTFTYEAIWPPAAIQAFKSLQCWHYQCCEGEAINESMYRTFVQVISLIGCAIASATPEYETAAWS